MTGEETITIRRVPGRSSCYDLVVGGVLWRMERSAGDPGGPHWWAERQRVPHSFVLGSSRHMVIALVAGVDAAERIGRKHNATVRAVPPSR